MGPYNSSFLAKPMKFLFQRSNYSDSLVFGNARWEEIKGHSLTTTAFQKKKFAMEVSGICLPYLKSYFQLHQWTFFFFLALKWLKFHCFQGDQRKDLRRFLLTVSTWNKLNLNLIRSWLSLSYDILYWLAVRNEIICERKFCRIYFCVLSP